MAAASTGTGTGTGLQLNTGDFFVVFTVAIVGVFDERIIPFRT